MNLVIASDKYAGTNSGEVMCHCRRAAILETYQFQDNLGSWYYVCGQDVKCPFFQWAEPIVQPVENYKNINRHPSRDESGYPLRGFDYTGPPCYKTEEIEVVDRTNEIVHPPELKGLKYTPELFEQWKQGKFKRR